RKKDSNVVRNSKYIKLTRCFAPQERKRTREVGSIEVLIFFGSCMFILWIGVFFLNNICMPKTESNRKRN
ncbi:hypothetical protein ACQP3D_30420, partial [Escherichia coli]